MKERFKKMLTTLALILATAILLYPFTTALLLWVIYHLSTH